MTQSTLSQSFSYKEVALLFEGEQGRWEAEQDADFDAVEARQETARKSPRPGTVYADVFGSARFYDQDVEERYNENWEDNA